MFPPSNPQQTGFRVRLPTVRPRWVYIFLTVNIILFLAMELSGGSDNVEVLRRFGANDVQLVRDGEYWRLVTANFLHIGILHLLVNSYALYILGGEVEALFGHPRFVVLYLLSGISGAIFSFMTQGIGGLSAGASTSLFGLFGALAVFFYKQRKLLGSIGQQRLISLGITLVINVIIGLSPGSHIDNWGHFGGLVGGVILGWFLCPLYELIDPLVHVFTLATKSSHTELNNGELMDRNSLAKQSFRVGLFALGLVALTILARVMQP